MQDVTWERLAASWWTGKPIRLYLRGEAHPVVGTVTRLGWSVGTLRKVSGVLLHFDFDLVEAAEAVDGSV